MADRRGRDSKRVEHIVENLKDNISKGDLDGLFHAIATHSTKDVGLSKKNWEQCFQIPTPEMIKVPTLDDLKARIKIAAEKKQVLRVAGALHSASMQQYVEDGGKPLLLTDYFRTIETWTNNDDPDDVLYCKAGGGCHLGCNEWDPEWKDSVCFKIDEKGFAFPILGGIMEQTVAGFMMTGSAGGSLTHGFCDVIQEIEFVDGTGKCQSASKDNNKDLFNAVGVSMGLFGVITFVTFRVGRKFYVQGVEENVDDSFLKDGAKLEKMLKDTEYLRINWFPQKFLNRVMQWTGKQEEPDDEKLVPYRHPLASRLVSIGAWLMLLINNCILGSPGELTDDWLYLIASLLDKFVPLSECAKQQFFDHWWRALPAEQQAPINTIIRVDFTEIWLPMAKCQEVMEKLDSMFQDPKAAGNFATEIYGAKKSDFWLSMSYGEDMVRIDPYWFHWNSGDKREFFTNFWNALLPLDEHVRLHWGKWLPEPGQICGDKVFNLAYLKEAFPKMEEWLTLRKKYDPNDVFLTDYWRNILEIP